MKSVSNIAIFKLFTKTTCENGLYYAEFGSSRLQKRLEYSGNVKNRLFLVIFKDEKIKDFVLTIDKAFTNLLTTPYTNPNCSGFDTIDNFDRFEQVFHTYYIPEVSKKNWMDYILNVRPSLESIRFWWL